MKKIRNIIIIVLVVALLLIFVPPMLVAETTYRVDHAVITGVTELEKYQHCVDAMEAGRRVSNACYDLVQQFGK